MTQAAALPTRLKEEATAAKIANATGSLRLAYLTTEYPKVSHTFIRREILELERRGHSVLRLAIRHSGGAVADAADAREAARTTHCLSQPRWRILWSIALAFFTRPAKSMNAFAATLAMNRSSDRGLIRHLAYLAEAAVLLRFLQRERIDHLHVHFGTNSAAVARLIRRLGGPPYSLTVHGPDEFDAPRGFSLAEKIIDAEFVIAISDFCAAQLRRWVPHDHWSKVHIVHCTVGEEFFDQSTPIDPRSTTFLSIGRLSAQKGQLVLVDAMKLLLDDGIDAHVILAGDGEMRDQIEKRIAEHGLESRIQITGWIDEATVRKHLLAARTLVQPSFAEGLPMVIMESLAMGRPVISTTVAGIPELVRQGESGWLVSAGNVHELAVAMREALQTPANRLNAMGQAGAQRVRQRHYTATETEKLESLFKSAAAIVRKGGR